MTCPSNKIPGSRTKNQESVCPLPPYSCLSDLGLIAGVVEKDVHRTDRTISPFMEEDLPHPDLESQYSGTNAHLEMLKDMLMTYNMYDNKEVGTTPSLSLPFPN